MRSVTLAALAAAMIGLGGHAIAATPKFDVRVDTSGADVVLAAALSDPVHAAAAADAALENPAVLALIAKMGKYDKAVTADAFKAAVVEVARGGSGAPFDLARLRKDPDPTRRMLARLKSDGETIAARIAERLSAFTPAGLDLQTRLFVLVGSNQNGWVPVQTVPDFYVDLGFHGEEVESVMAVASHELFHVVQGKLRPDWTAEFKDRPDLPPDGRGLHRAHAVLENLFLEGMATYVGDATAFTATGPHIARDQRELKRNLARADEIFALFDTVLYRARHDPDAPLDTLLNIGFGGAWDQTGYYVGYRMAQVIDRYLGRERLRTLVTLPPEAFISDYIALSQAHRDDPQITHLSSATVATVADLKQLGDRRP